MRLMQCGVSSRSSILLVFLHITIGNPNIFQVDGLNADNNSAKIEIETEACTYQINHPCDATDKIKFILYTGNGANNGFVMDPILNSTPPSYNSALPLKVVIHGYAASRFVYNIVKAYISKGNINVLLVDWEPLSKKPCYFSAKVNTWQVGKCTSLAVSRLVPASHVHIVGFSLGAHVAGIVSNYLYQQFGTKAHRITGLDPALPLFATPLGNLKLDASDADFVDVIHTSVGTFGKVEPSGHQDFYVNDYPTQPGCFDTPYSVICSHGRSTELFAESIRTDVGFWAKSCSSVWSYFIGLCSNSESGDKEILMGEYTDPANRGIFYLKTSDTSPYALGRTNSN